MRPCCSRCTCARHDLHAQVTGQSSVGLTNATFIGNVDGNSQGGALAVGQGGLVQVYSFTA